MSHSTKALFTTIVLAVLVAGVPCQGAWIYWNGSLDNDFMKTSNWDSYRVPDTRDVAAFANGGTAVLSDTWTVDRVQFRPNQGGTLVIGDGGNLTVNSKSEDSFASGTIIVDGGTYNSNWTRVGLYAGHTSYLVVDNPASLYTDRRLWIGDNTGAGEVTFGKGHIDIETLVLTSGNGTSAKFTVIGGDNDITIDSMEKKWGTATLRFELNPFTARDEALVTVLGTAEFRADSHLEVDLGDAPQGTYILMEAGTLKGAGFLNLAAPTSDSGYTTYEQDGRIMLNVTRAVPEPTTLAGLAVLGVAGLVRRRRRRA